ncbi:MAG TPA: phosphate ABC transporter substrate-binding protein [bacterium]|nr:phosphate ABC transporter substrate-binding protein [bacterium]HOL66506.1 phosphate ABC transporter substrate-binding protein [bacterium]HPP11403.1 phosphate ABC transporter substrate-binding protein [bacterium]
MKQRKFSVGALSIVMAFCLSISGVAREARDIVIAGSTTVLPIAQKAAEVFMKKHPGTKISVMGGGSGVGIASLIDGHCDIASASRAMKAAEIQKAQARGIQPKAHTVALDGIAVVVHPSNPVSNLSIQQIKDIYSGAISDWKVVGGNPGKIVVLSRDTASGTYEAFGELVLKKARVRPDALMQASNQAIASVVAKTVGAIGYVGLGYLSNQVKAVSVNGVLPSVETVLSGKYPVSRPLFMYTNGAPSGILKDFLDFVKGAEGQRLVAGDGFVPLK